MLAVCKKTRAEATEQIAVPRGVPWISGKRQPPSDTYALLCIIYIYMYNHRRKFRNQTSDNMDRDEKQRWEESEKRRE